tara:strand:+ start:2142 stop:2954 length:813 start_codon:yes stop_codon:yes gene_type:complete
LKRIITKEQADLYYNNYKYVNYTLPNSESEPALGNFMDKISYSLYQLIGLIKDGEQDKWGREGNTSDSASNCIRIEFHSWLTIVNDEIVYDTRGRNDDFCNNLCRDMLDAYTSDDFDYYYYTLLQSVEHRKNVDAVIEYYRSTSFYTHYVNKYTSLGYLAKQDWDRMSNNKYSKAVIKISNTDPAFEVGELVLPRASFASQSIGFQRQPSIRTNLNPKHIMILTNDEKVVSAVKGGRRYKVVGMGNGQASPFYVEERYMKKNRKLMNKKK